MKYKPTPRDLFNPPPQHIPNMSVEEFMDELTEKIWNLNPTGEYTEEQNLFYGILALIKDHEERIGGRS
jgi:hypothetical protein